MEMTTMATLAAPKIEVELKVVPILKTIVYAALAGELVANTGMKDNDQINAIQQAVSEGLIEKVIVSARRPDGGVETSTFTMIPPAPGETIDLALMAGKSMLETVDVALAAGVKYAADLIKRQGLTPEFRVAWSARVQANPALGADAIKRLNLRADDLPKPPAPLPPAFLAEFDPLPPPALPKPAPPRYPQAVNTYTGRLPIPPTQVYKRVLEIKPAADKGITFTHETSVPIKSK
jgi:hypothetical protein